MKRTVGRFLLTILIISASVMSVLEMGHDVLHTISNPFHNHSLTHRKSLVSHTIKDHGFKKMRFAYQMEEPSGPPNLMLLLFGVTPWPETIVLIKLCSAETLHSGQVTPDLIFSKPPPTPPPSFS